MVKDDVLLVAGNLTSVSVDVVEAWRKEVIDSILFSRLYANSKVDRFAESQQWSKYYSEAMGVLKWQVGSSKFTSLELNDGGSFVLKHLIRDKLKSVVDLSRVEQYERLMYSIEQNPAAEVIASSAGEHAIVRQFKGGGIKISTVVLQVSLIGRGPDICSVFVCFDTAQEVKHDFLSQEFKNDLIFAELNIGVSKLMLNKASYEKARTREKVIDSLPEFTAPLILHITPEIQSPGVVVP